MTPLRRLPPEEWPRLGATLSGEFGVEGLPDPAVSEVWASFDGDELVCFFVLELVIHAGPFVVNPSYRGRGVARMMAEKALELTEGREGYISATRPEIDHLAESMGLVPVKGRLWCKEA